MRQSANDPQIQLSEDLATVLASEEVKNNAEALGLGTKAKIDIEKSLAPFIVVYNDKGEPKTGTGFIDGQLPQIPQGVFDFAKQHKQNRVTWQPRYSIRQAIVVTAVENNGGFVLVGRSLREIEKRVEQLQTIILVVWLTSLIIIGLTTILTRKKKN